MKKFIVIIFVLLCICGCQKEKSHEDLALEAIKARDRDACLLESDEAMKEKGMEMAVLADTRNRFMLTAHEIINLFHVEGRAY
ncbi:MAG: hypothetical protein ILA55_06385, partial [Erysipelotrichaceae bacterium]|nr:hypothetical protein [Erysipelotrichaceae bacterium]